MSLVLDVRPSSRKSPSMCWKIRYNSRTTRWRSCPAAVDHQSPLVNDMCSILEPRRVDAIMLARVYCFSSPINMNKVESAACTSSPILLRSGSGFECARMNAARDFADRSIRWSMRASVSGLRIASAAICSRV